MDTRFLNTLDPAVFEAIKAIRPKLRLCGPLRILFVVDGAITYNTSFGVGRVAALLNDTARGWVDFQVDTKFKSEITFSDASLRPYHQVWLFGYNGGNGSLSSGERTALLKWMDERRGGVFATGDHDDLGAALCRQVPRAGTMRRWTQAQGVPPGAGPARVDTNRPANASQGAPTYAQIPIGAQSDAVPQRVQWVTWMRSGGGLLGWRAPHPILCHPQHGPIDVMPDHPHEGVCFDTAPGRFEVDVSSATEYPTRNGVRPLPTVIAYGTTLPDPPYNFAKGDSPAKRFPMISVYDGQSIGIGRVVVDSTWHHWMDLNIIGLEAAGTAPGASAQAVANWEKIREYFVNIAVWLATPQQRRCMARWYFTTAHYNYVGFQELRTARSLLELGQITSSYLRPILGPCWVRQFVLDLVLEVHPRLFDLLGPTFLGEDFGGKAASELAGLSGPGWDAFEAHVLGAVMQASMKQHAKSVELLLQHRKLDLPVNDAEEAEVLLGGALDGLRAFEQAVQADVKRIQPWLTALKSVEARIPVKPVKPAKR
ncbi:MAG: hypothetical protein QM772_03425 [Ottowia sp.]|uniref:hypothetical protein n=1 Tax=Ottowia sp. TaxID=1898956 RepID=UPI0039E3DFAB